MAGETYNGLANILDGRSRWQVANKTYLFKGFDGALVVHYYDTDMIRAYPTGDVYLNTGGMATKSTLVRFNRLVSDAQVYQEDNRWFIRYKGKTYRWPTHGLVHIDERSNRLGAVDPQRYSTVVPLEEAV